MPTRRAAVVGGNRIPFARAGGPYAQSSNQAMLTAALEGLVTRLGLAGEQLGEVVGGAVLKHSRDYNLTRECVLGSALAPTTPAYDVQQACGTGMQACILLANKIALGQVESGVAGGVDSVSDAPLAVNDDLRRMLLAMSRGRNLGDRLSPLRGIRPGQVVPETPPIREPRTGLSMGEHAAITARQWQISRMEQDDLAVRSHRSLAAAYDRDFFDALVTPFQGLERDENLRPDATLDSVGRLRPVFGTDHPETATLTAANSTPLSDGAATVLLASDLWAQDHGLPVLAHVVDAQTAAVDYVNGDEGMLMAPAYAVPQLLARNGLTLQDFDFVEMHEAFASSVLATLKAWEDPAFCTNRLGLDVPLGHLEPERLNVVGSSLATGHPFAATGGRIVATLASLLAERGSGRGLATACAAGGQGVAMILEAA